MPHCSMHISATAPCTFSTCSCSMHIQHLHVLLAQARPTMSCIPLVFIQLHMDSSGCEISWKLMKSLASLMNAFPHLIFTGSTRSVNIPFLCRVLNFLCTAPAPVKSSGLCKLHRALWRPNYGSVLILDISLSNTSFGSSIFTELRTRLWYTLLC